MTRTRQVTGETDIAWMRIALQLARRGVGLTRPNPPVGAVVVRHGRIVGQGWHRLAGGPHAEIAALRQAGQRARGATLYVTLEPCCTHGRTPPCTESIIGAGLGRVVFAARDPNPRHRGRGIRQLRSAGILVSSGVCRAEAAEIIRPFARHITIRHPLVTLKLAVTLDGRIADAAGRARWLSGPSARAMVQTLRRSADAIMVGSGTVRTDDPSLIPRPAHGRMPYRVVVDASGAIPSRARVVSDDFRKQTIVATTRRCPVSRMAMWRNAGVRVMVLPAKRGQVDLKALLRELGRLGLMHVLCEGGGILAGQLVKESLVDQLYWVSVPMLLGDKGVPAIGGAAWPLPAAPQFEFQHIQRYGKDRVMRLTPSAKKG
mgnify:CR=1 FL=1